MFPYLEIHARQKIINLFKVDENQIEQCSWADFLGGGLGGLNSPKFFLTPFWKCLTPLEFCYTPWRTLVCHFMPLPKHHERDIVYDLPPT